MADMFGVRLSGRRRRRLAGALVNGFAEINPIAKQLVEEPFVDRAAALVGNALADDLAGQPRRRSQLNEALEDVADLHCFRFIDH